MNINYFDTLIDAETLAAGMKYFKSGKVISIEQFDNNYYVSWVSDDDKDYEVSIEMDNDGQILSSICDCDCGYGKYCIHKTAVLYAIRNKISGYKSITDFENINIIELLSSQSKDALLKALYDISLENSSIRDKIILRFSSGEIASKLCCIEFLRIISPVKHNDSMEFQEIEELYNEIAIILERIKNEKNTIDAIYMAISASSCIAEIRDCSEDIESLICNTLDKCIEIVDEQISKGIFDISNEDAEAIFDKILEEASKECYDEYIEARIGFFSACVTFVRNSVLKNKLVNTIIKYIPENPKEYFEHYTSEKMKGILASIYEYCGDTQNLESFLNENIMYPNFRKIAIERAISSGDYDTALELAQNAVSSKNVIDDQFDRELKEIVLWLYEKKGEKQKYIETLKDFVYSGDMRFLHIYKIHFQGNEWNTKLKKMIKYFEYSERPWLCEKILLEEQLYIKLLEFCEKETCFILRNFKILYNIAPKRVDALMEKELINKAEAVYNNSMFEELYCIIKEYLKISATFNFNSFYNKIIPIFQDKLDYLNKLKDVKRNI